MINARKLSPKERFKEYTEGVRAGNVVACEFVKLAVDRHFRDLERIGKKWEYEFDEELADVAVDFIEGLRHSKGRWARRRQKIKLEGWQVFIVRSLFGWVHKVTGFRRFRIGYCEVARKNGKSTLAAAVGLKLFVADNEPGAEVYSTATSRAQAKVVHEEAKNMARQSPTLRPYIHITRDNLRFGTSKYEPLASDERAHEGRNVSGAIVDELHLHRTRAVFDVMDTGTGAREQSLLLMITTAGEGGETESICWEQHEYTRQVLEGIIDDDSWFGIIFALDAGDDWLDEKVWPKANPNIDVSVSRDNLRAKITKAKNVPTAAMAIRQKHFDEWVASRNAWMTTELWNRNAGDVAWYAPGQVFSDQAREYFKGRECYIGADLSTVRDLTGIVAAFPTDDERVEVLAWGWVPKQNAIGFARDRRTPYLTYEEQGFLELTKGEAVDYLAFRKLMVFMRDELEFDIQEIAFDPYNASHAFQALENEDDFDEEQLVEHRQGAIKMNDPIKLTEKLLLEGRIVHGNNRALNWCVSNVVAHLDQNGNVQFDKRKSREKIDLAVCLVMAIGRAVAGGAVSEDSVYESRGLLCLS